MDMGPLAKFALGPQIAKSATAGLDMDLAESSRKHETTGRFSDIRTFYTVGLFVVMGCWLTSLTTQKYVN